MSRQWGHYFVTFELLSAKKPLISCSFFFVFLFVWFFFPASVRGSTQWGNPLPRKTSSSHQFQREALITRKSRRTRHAIERPKISPSPLQAPLQLTSSRGRMAETCTYPKRQMLLWWEPLRDVVNCSYKCLKVLCSSVESEPVWKTATQQLTTYWLPCWKIGWKQLIEALRCRFSEVCIAIYEISCRTWPQHISGVKRCFVNK